MSDHEKKKSAETKTKTLDDAEIVSVRAGGSEGAKDGPSVSRRSMIGVLAGGAAAVVMPACVVRRPGVVYTQPAAAPRGSVVVAQPQQGRYRTNVTDSDGGAYADPAGYGRGQRAQGHTGVTDSDSGAWADPAGSGRGVYGRTSGVTDSDGGAYADPVGNGRGRARGGYSGITDSDGGPYADPSGHGRGRWR
ncbi:MAG: hypothetical protein M3Y87_32460 [Myxococcota bacterium]|nr:hypothetical protein [Myxococcota bacterium]